MAKFCKFGALSQAKYHDWKEFLVKRLTGARTLPTAFYKVVYFEFL